MTTPSSKQGSGEATARPWATVQRETRNGVRCVVMTETEFERARNAFDDLVAALEPFVLWIEKADGPTLSVAGWGKSSMELGITGNTADDHVVLKLSPECPPVTIGDFRRARGALRKATAHPDKGE